MKKILLFILMLLVLPISVDASNVYNIDIDINVDIDGNALITEVWDVEATDGTEWYKPMYNLKNSVISNFKVYMDGNELRYKVWDVDESLKEKAGYYGINYTDSGVELCFGKNDYKRHTFKLVYNFSNIIFNTSDSQIFYNTIIPSLPDVDFSSYSIKIRSFSSISDDIPTWGFGTKGYTYVRDGIVESTNDGFEIDKNLPVVVLIKFPLNTFNTTNVIDGYDDFDTVYGLAKKGTFKYDYENKSSFIENIFYFILNFLPFIIFAIVVIAASKNGYGYIGNKKINKKEVPMFRDIPCNKDIYYANALIKLNNFDYKESNILGAILLKWVRTDKIAFRSEVNGIFNKETSVIDLTMNPSFDNDLESKLFKMMFEASKDGILETREFEKWSSKNYSEFLDLFKRLENNTIDDLKSSGYIRNRLNKQECKKKNVMEDKIYNDSIQLYGLKKYLLEFSSMNTKEVMEVKLWDEYLMFAYLFGIADKVAKQFKNMYPEVIEQMEMSNFDYDTIIFVNNISTRTVSAASSARSAAESYSAGGGGFNIGGGGGGSIGGGGSGCSR